MKLTSKERIMRIFRNEDIDRSSFKLWGTRGLGEKLLHPAYEPINKLALETTDVFVNFAFPFDLLAGTQREKYIEKYTVQTADPKWVDEYTILHTPKGDLRQIERQSTVNEYPYVLEYFVKEPEDIEKILSMEYAPIPFDRSAYDAASAYLGDRGIVLTGINEAGYALHQMMGSETLAYFSVDCREELKALAEVFSKRIHAHVNQIMDLGIKTPLKWVGPEVFLPPLLGPNEFEDFVYTYDKPVCDLIHNRGGYVWVHSHGRVGNYLDRFIDMGVDVLNPLEPKPNGDVDLAAAVKKYGRQIGWEGNIEIQDIIQGTPEKLAALIDECAAAGAPSGRFIFGQSAGYPDYTNPSPQYIENLMFYLRYGLETIEKYKY